MENPNYHIQYTGELRTKMVHIKSATEVVTDAPVDNNGKGESFSPTDLVASGLCACMLTVIGIHYDKLGKELKPIDSEIKKVMASNPRRISEVHIRFDFGDNQFDESEKEKIKNLAMNCPVANSLSKEIVVVTDFGWN